MKQCVLFDWGDTVMRDFSQFDGPMNAWPEVETVEGIRELLEVLRPTCLTALATNAEDSDEAAIWIALSRVDLFPCFDRVFCIANIGQRKPSEAFFREVLRRLDLPASSVYMIGDTFESDIAGANSVGIRGVWFNPNSDESRHGSLHRTVHELESVPDALRSLGADV